MGWGGGTGRHTGQGVLGMLPKPAPKGELSLSICKGANPKGRVDKSKSNQKARARQERMWEGGAGGCKAERERFPPPF